MMFFLSLVIIIVVEYNGAGYLAHVFLTAEHDVLSYFYWRSSVDLSWDLSLSSSAIIASPP